MDARPSRINAASIGSALVGAAKGLADALVPATCLCCERRVVAAGTACPECWCELRFIERPYCEVLGTPFTYDLGPGALSAEVIAAPPPFQRARAPLAYEGAAIRLVTALKFADRTDLAPWMARWMWRAAHDYRPTEGEGRQGAGPVLVPVPLHRARMVQRSTNQAGELTRALARLSGFDHRPDWLVRPKHTRPQVGLGREARIRNMAGAFAVPETARSDLQGRRVVLVDDVFTTGATLAACARVLKRGGARHVDCLTFARVVKEV